MIDLHSHILPGVDDGAPSLEASVAMARVAASDGIRTMVATPHINSRYGSDLDHIDRLAGELNVALARAGVPVAVLTGGEVAVSRLPEFSDDALRRLCLGTGPAILVESPYARSAPFLDEALFDLQVRSFQPILAHPERCPVFQSDLERLRTLVRRGIHCSIGAGSMTGAFGSTVRRFVDRLFGEGLVHDVSSDAHDHLDRPPVLTRAFEHAETQLPGILAQRDWFTVDASTALLAGEPLPARPDPLTLRGRWRRLLGRR